MFCSKCGTKALDGAEFCQKCGAKLIADTPVGQSALAPPASSAQIPTQTTRSAFEKKKSKLPTILGVAAALILVLAIMAIVGNKGVSDPDVIVGNSHAPSEVDTQSAEVLSSTPTDSLLFRGSPIQDIVGANLSDIIAIFGEPETQSEYSVEYGIDEWEGFAEEGWMCFYLDNANQVNMFSADPVHFTFEGQSLVQDFDTLVTILGDDYTDMGGTAYSWHVFWNYSDYQIYFTFSDNKPHSIDIVMPDLADSATPADDDDYSWVEGDIDDSLLRDQALVGRWRAYDGGYVEFSEYGEAAMSFSPHGSVLIPDFITWEASNGRITLSSHFSETSTWEIKDSGSEQMLTLSRYNDQRYYRSELGTSLVGTWDSGAFSGFGDLVLLSDGTGKMNRIVSSDPWAMDKVPITWRSDDTNFYVNWTLLSTYDYTVSGDILTIYFSNGSQIYTKIGN